MSLTAASTLSHRAQCVRAASISGFTTSLSNRQQTRSYWFDRDSSNYFRNAYRRHAGLRSRCVETLQQGLSWNKESAPEENAAYIKRVTFGYWHKNQRKCFPGERWASTGSTLRTPDNPTGVRPGQNIEDAERAPLEGLLFGTPAETKPSWQQAKDKARARKAAKRTNTDVKTDYVYDPIANRKVPISAVGQSSEEVDAPNASFKSYRSQFSTLQPPVLDDKQSPIFYDGPPPPSELEKYSHVEIDSSPWEANTAKSSQEPASRTSSSTPSAPEVVRALENMQKEALGYQSDITTHSPLPPDVSVGAFQGNVGLGSEDPAGYTPFLSHEPDGMYKAVSEQEAQPEELTKYEAVRSHEPDGKYKAIEEDSSPSQELSEYGAVRSHEPDGKYKVVEKDNLSSQELSKYGAVRSHEPDGKYAVPYTDPVPDPAEVDHYSKPYLSHEPDGKYAASYAEPIIKDDAELERYQPFRSHEPDGKYAAEITTEDKQENLDQYQRGFRSHEPNGKYAAEADQVSEDSDLGNHEAFNSEDSKTLTMPSQKRGPTEDAAELETYKEVGHDEPVERNPANLWNKNSDARVHDAAGDKTEYRKLVEDLMARQAAEDDFHTSASGPSNPPSDGSGSTEGTSTGRRRLTGQYAQDFPEDFAVAWSTETSETKSSLLPTDLGSPSSTDLPTSGQPLPASALEPALGRHKSDPTSSPSASASRAEPQPTTLYKVLVYDPVMQAVDVAETTSVVSDSAAPLTPAEVLLRISNPARFFPHFAPLQAQGFEIVSGSGDVLIFRKVRDPVQSPEETVKPAETISVTKDAPINPIDMTGGSPYNVAASRFASPTGFVNYELPLAGTGSSGRSAEQRAGMERMAKSANEDLTRRLERLEKETKKKDLGKRMVIGGVSLAGLMYGFGLAGDSVKHGRMEVKGPNQKKT